MYYRSCTTCICFIFFKYLREGLTLTACGNLEFNFWNDAGTERGQMEAKCLQLSRPEGFFKLNTCIPSNWTARSFRSTLFRLWDNFSKWQFCNFPSLCRHCTNMSKIWFSTFSWLFILIWSISDFLKSRWVAKASHSRPRLEDKFRKYLSERTLWKVK